MAFNSQICTTREQSERLIALGLKKETADMALIENWDWNDEEGKFFTGKYFERPIDYTEGMEDKWIPAWSFGRLLEIFLGYEGYRNILFVRGEEHMEYLLRHIEVYIQEGYIDKKYLNK